MKENKTYIAADFERYYAGTMPPHEMHALEKAALEDQFLADALEGYINTSDFAGDILELKARLKEKEKKKNIFSISPFAQNRWWRIAALFIIIAGAGFFFYQLNFIDKQDSFARNELKPSETKKENITPIVKDSTTANNDVAFEEKTASQSSGKKKPDVLKSSARNEKDNAAPKLKKRNGAIASSASKSKDTAVENNIAMNDEGNAYIKDMEKQYPLKGNVTDEIGAPVPYATVTESGTRNSTTADAAGHFLLQSPDSIILAKASATGYDSKKFILQKRSDSTIALKRNHTELSTVVVTTALGIKRKKSAQLDKTVATKKLKEKASAAARSETANQPFPKNEEFDKYLQEIIVPLFDSNNNKITGEVVLSFTINNNGRPENIKVVKSSCAACEKLAVALLENGPDWIVEKQKWQTVLIKF